MKEVKAIIQPLMLDAVVDALRGVEGLWGAAISEATSVSLRADHFEQSGKTKLEIMVPDELVEAVVATIQQAAHTGNRGDGRIFVIPIEDAVWIRTGEHVDKT